MKPNDPLMEEFEHEARTTRRHLERLPDDKLDWRPHEKSFMAGALAAHMVESISWGDSIFSSDEVNFDPTTYKPYIAGSVADLLKSFDDAVARCRQAMADAADESLAHTWHLKVMGKVQFERPKTAAFRDFTLSHVIHHRGQFSVYLRLLNVPVPGSYGPSADEQ